jgi:hypothetical protein
MGLENLLRLLNDPVGVCEGLILSNATLRRAVKMLNAEQGRWWLEDPMVAYRVNHLNIHDLRMVQIFHSRSGPDQATDELGLMLPVIGDPADTDCALVCLAPELIHFALEGLYLENGRVLGDPLTDFERVWNSLRCAVIEVGRQDGTIW